jgi:sigma-B regulation protein RsbU (phosphoserine phosphatase)
METERARLLVVDDVEANRDLLARRLARLGHHVTLARDGREALQKLGVEEFDLVLLDIMMPEVDGYRVLQELQADPARRHIPVIMISAVDELASVVRCIEMGATDYLAKPFNAVLLKARVQSTLEKKRLLDRERLYAKSLERELEIGREIQAGFLPDQMPQPPGWRIAARFRPARKVGGDFYDAFAAAQGERVALVLADVCDKGVGAALFMALFRSLLRAAATRVDFEPSAAGLRRAVGETNDYIARTHERSNMFATVFFGLLEPSTGSLLYVNAGQEPPIVQGAEGIRERLAPTGPAVGLLPERDFQVGQIRLAPGELLFAFTDGVTEARSPSGELFGEPRVAAVLEGRAVPVEDLLARIEESVNAHCGGAESNDDLTMIALAREEPSRA